MEVNAVKLNWLVNDKTDISTKKERL